MVALTADTITDEQICELRDRFPRMFTENLVAGALGACEPHRNHSRHRCAELANGLLCECWPNAEEVRSGRVVNHVPGHRFVGWGHGWQPCIVCGGTGWNALGRALAAEARARCAEILNARTKAVQP